MGFQPMSGSGFQAEIQALCEALETLGWKPEALMARMAMALEGAVELVAAHCWASGEPGGVLYVRGESARPGRRAGALADLQLEYRPF